MVELVKGEGPKPCEIMVIGEAPGRHEVEQGRPFVGQAGRLLMDTLEEAGLSRDDCYLTNVVKYQPPENKTPKVSEIKAARKELFKEMGKVKPRFVLLLGNVPCQAVLDLKGIKKLRGKPIEQDGTIFMPIYHPSFIMRDPRHENTFKADIQLFRDIISNGEIPKEKGLNIVIVNSMKKHKACLKALKGTVGADLETSGLYPWEEGSAVNIIGLSTKSTQWIYLLRHPATGRDYRHIESEIGLSVQEIVEDLDEKVVDCRLVGQNWKFDHLWMRVHFDVCWYAEFDTMLAHFLLDENSPHSLDYISQFYFGAIDYDIPLKEKLGLEGTVESFVEYAAKDIYYTRRAYFKFKKMLHKEGDVERVFREIMMPCHKVFCDIEFRGVYVDMKQFKIVEKKLRKDLKKAVKELAKHDPSGEINWGSPAQLGQLLFEKLGLDIIETTASGKPATSESVLKRIDHPIVESLLAYRAASKQLSAFIEGWKPYIDKDNRIHPTFKLHGTVTGRLSCAHPNLQQVPRDPTIRSLLTAEPGWTMVEVDLSQIELRIAAELSGDPEMVKAFQEGTDVHWLTAIREIARGKGMAKEVLATGKVLAGKKVSYDKAIKLILEAGPGRCQGIEKKWKELRKKAKAINFGYLYGMWWKKFKDYARDNYGIKDMTDKDAEASRIAYFDTYAGLPDWHNKQRRYARLNGYVLSLSGRKRRLPAATIQHDCPERGAAERQAINSPVQSFANELNLMSLIEVSEDISYDYCRPVGTVHDAILLEVRDDKIKEVVTQVLEIMSHPRLLDTFDIKMKVPIEADGEIGPWGKGVELERYLENV